MNFKINKSTKIYISGCGGMLGLAMYNLFSKLANVKATDIDVNEDWLTYADVRDMESIKASINEFDPDVIINLAAITDMELCEKESDNAWRTNSLGSENVALIALQLNIPHVYISTAGIFGGEKEFFNDFDTPNPLSVYAKSKYAGELFVKQTLPKYFVVRAGWMMGGGPVKDKKFINKIYKQLLEGKTTLDVVDDKLGTPTYTVDFAKGILALLESGYYGVYNQVCPGSCSRYEVAVSFIKQLEMENIININRVSSDFFSKEYYAPRPQSEKLINMKLIARNLLVMRDWETCLTEYSLEYKQNWNSR
ncbi:MAG: NAD(P)-dependent oxidoreductase [Planctomycetota bacterium]|nr:MAG: NAD(P)-dependent oxidoreductase [Planctomycetota bacterium]